MYNYNPNYNQDERIWVANAQAAEAYPMAPGSFVRLWDSNEPVFYEKRSDINGRLFPMEIYEYKKRVFEQANPYQTQLDEMKARIEALEKGVAYEQSNANDSAV